MSMMMPPGMGPDGPGGGPGGNGAGPSGPMRGPMAPPSAPPRTPPMMSGGGYGRSERPFVAPIASKGYKGLRNFAISSLAWLLLGLDIAGTPLGAQRFIADYGAKNLGDFFAFAIVIALSILFTVGSMAFWWRFDKYGFRADSFDWLFLALILVDAIFDEVGYSNAFFGVSGFQVLPLSPNAGWGEIIMKVLLCGFLFALSLFGERAVHRFQDDLEESGSTNA